MNDPKSPDFEESKRALKHAREEANRITKSITNQVQAANEIPSVVF